MNDDDLVAAIRVRAADPDRRLAIRTSAFQADLGSLDLGGMLVALGEAQRDLARLLEDPLNPPPDLHAKASMLHASMTRPADEPLPAPATAQQVDDAERALGTALPPLLRRLYVEVANGGFGPGYGLLGIPPGGWTDDRRRDLVALHAEQREPVTADGWRWPATLLPVCYLGDVVYACVDGSRPGAPVLEYDPSDLEWDDDGTPLDEEEALVEVSPSLSAWLQGWVESPSAAEEQAALEAQADASMREQMKAFWATLPPEQRAELGITDEALATGELPDSWR